MADPDGRYVDDGRWHPMAPHVAFSPFSTRPTTYRGRVARLVTDWEGGEWDWKTCSHKHRARVEATKCSITSADDLNRRDGL
jgi:hypothetical protein